MRDSPPYEIVIGIGLVVAAAAIFLVASLVRMTGSAMPTPTPVPSTPPPTTPSTARPTATAAPTLVSPIPTIEMVSPSAAALESAPDFTLPRADGSTFTLSKQLARGPVVLVFFQVGG